MVVEIVLTMTPLPKYFAKSRTATGVMRDNQGLLFAKTGRSALPREPTKMTKMDATLRLKSPEAAPAEHSSMVAAARG